METYGVQLSLGIGILILDAAVLLSTYFIFAMMAHGRKALLGELAPVILRSENYLAESDWRR